MTVSHLRYEHKLLCLLYLITYAARVSVGCFGYDDFITNAGSELVGFYISIAAGLTLFIVFSLLFLFQRFSTEAVLSGLHLMLAFIIIGLFFVADRTVQAKGIFLGISSFGVLYQYGNSLLANRQLTAFENKRIFPVLTIFLQVGAILGTMLALSANFGLPNEVIVGFWLLCEIVTCLLIFRLPKREKEEVNPGTKRSFRQLCLEFRLGPQIFLWKVIWGMVTGAMIALTAPWFSQSPIDITALYGALSVVIAVASLLFTSLIYPFMVRHVFYGNHLIFGSIAVAFAFSGFFIAPGFASASVLFFFAFLIENITVILFVETSLRLYGDPDRDVFRLWIDIIAPIAGNALVFLIFLMPKGYLVVALAITLAALTVTSFAVHWAMIIDSQVSLDGDRRDRLTNALAIFNAIHIPRLYQRVVGLLSRSRDLEVQKNVLHAFSDLKSPKPLSEVILIMTTTADSSVLMAGMQYIDQLKEFELDPFDQFRLVEVLKEAGFARRNPAPTRALALKLLIRYWQLDQTLAMVKGVLASNQPRQIADTIEAMRHLEYPGVRHWLLPFLQHVDGRVRANTIMALTHLSAEFLWEAEVDAMLNSRDPNLIASGIFVIGELKLQDFADWVRTHVDSAVEKVRRNAHIALLKLGFEGHHDTVVDLILGDNEELAVNTCYLTLGLDLYIRNEVILPAILARQGAAAASDRFRRCGIPCADLLDLLVA